MLKLPICYLHRILVKKNTYIFLLLPLLLTSKASATDPSCKKILQDAQQAEIEAKLQKVVQSKIEAQQKEDINLATASEAPLQQSNRVQAINKTAIDLIEVKKYSEALPHLEKAITLNPENIIALELLVKILPELKATNKFIYYSQELLKVQNPQQTSTLFSLSKALIDKKRSREAIPHLERLIELNRDINPKSISGVALMIEALIKLKQQSKLLKYLDLILASRPNDLLFLRRKGETLSRLRQFKEATEIGKTILSLKPKDRVGIGITQAGLVGLRKYEEALFYVEMELEISPRNIVALGTKAKVLSKIQQTEKSIDVYLDILAYYPSDKRSLVLLPIELIKLGKTKEAFEVLENLENVVRSEHPWVEGRILHIKDSITNLHIEDAKADLSHLLTKIL